MLCLSSWRGQIAPCTFAMVCIGPSHAHLPQRTESTTTHAHARSRCHRPVPRNGSASRQLLATAPRKAAQSLPRRSASNPVKLGRGKRERKQNRAAERRRGQFDVHIVDRTCNPAHTNCQLGKQSVLSQRHTHCCHSILLCVISCTVQQAVEASEKGKERKKNPTTVWRAKHCFHENCALVGVEAVRKGKEQDLVPLGDEPSADLRA